MDLKEMNPEILEKYLIESTFKKTNNGAILLPENFSRTSFCKKCAQKGMPKLGQRVLVRRGTQGEFMILTVSEEYKHNEWGFTPHLIEKPFLKRDQYGNYSVDFYICCGIEKCGIEIIEKTNVENNSLSYTFNYIGDRPRITYPLKQFISFLHYKDQKYYLKF